MHDDRELNIDELAAVAGGTNSNNNGSLPHPKPSPWDQLIQLILAAVK